MSDKSIVGNLNYPTDYRIGTGNVRTLPAVCAELGIYRPLIVTDKNIPRLDWFQTVVRDLDGTALKTRVFSDIDPNPSSDHVAAGIAAFTDHRADGCVVVGGGSAMDTGKCIVLLVDNPGTVFDYEDDNDNWKRADSDLIAPCIAIPTTAGTGSEVGRAAVILDPLDKTK